MPRWVWWAAAALIVLVFVVVFVEHVTVHVH